MEKVTNAFTDKDMSEMILKLKEIVELSLQSAKRIDRSDVAALAEGVLSKLMDGKSELDW
jgi:hypothetical protein